jgi:hypothetical protein
LLLFLQDYIVAFLAFAAFSIKIIFKSGKIMSRELLGSPSASPILKSTPSPPISNPVSKSIESVLRNTVSLPPTTQNTPEMAHYYAATRFKKIKSSSNKPVLIKYESKESDISKSPLPPLTPSPPRNTPEIEKLLPHYHVVTTTHYNPLQSERF